MAKERQAGTYSNITDKNEFIYFFSNQNNVSYGQKEKKHSKINMNLSKIVTYCVTFHFLESVNMSSSRGVSKLLCVLITYLCSHIPIYKIYNGALYRYTQSETQP
jgi:hypothetical protein